MIKLWLSLLLTGFASLSFSAVLPFREAVKAGDTLYVSGQIGYTLQNGQVVLVEGGMEAETKQTMENIKQVLADNGYSLDDVVKCNVMMPDLREWPKMDAVYASYFKEGKFPARSAFGATGLAFNAHVEIECIAVKGHE